MSKVTEAEVRAAVVMLRAWHPVMQALFREAERRLRSLEAANGLAPEPRFADVVSAVSSVPPLRLDQLVGGEDEGIRDAARAKEKAAVAALRGAPGDAAPADLGAIGAALLRALETDMMEGRP